MAMKELFTRMVLGRLGPLASPTTPSIGESDHVSDSAVARDNQTCGEPRSSTKRRHDNGLVDQYGPSITCQEDASRRPKCPRMESSRRQKVVCPYMKYDPVEYSLWTTCPGPGFNGMNRLKEHLKRRHFKELSCARCGQQFGAGADLHEHNRAPTACEVTHDGQHLGFMTQLQWDDIRKRRGQATTEVERWKEIYKLLFPAVDVGQIPSPYHEAPEAMRPPGRLIDYNEYEVYLQQNLPQRFMAQLSLEFQALEEGHIQRMAKIVQEQSAEISAAFLRDRVVDHDTKELPKVASAEQPLVQDGFFLDFLDTTDAVLAEPLGEWMFAD